MTNFSVQRQNADGSWASATPLQITGWKAKVEAYFRKKGFKRLAYLMGVWDERGLG